MKYMIYGAGVRCRRMLEQWGKSTENEIAGIYDKEKTGTVMGIPISKYEEGLREVPVIISLANQKLVMEIEKDLRRAGYQTVYWYRENPYEDTLAGQLEDMGAWGDAVLPQAEMHISDACNLNCRGCTHFSPLFHSIDAELASRLEDVRKLAGKVTHILDFYLLGGGHPQNPSAHAADHRDERPVGSEAPKRSA